ncbi:unnamed protein product [Linum tenue]|uniref:Protein kinase domain-containing protein n=1 Tax=Linum tenue TaxID=586396 RepID=A0AAV0RIP9_9ROSI|nr:unnamed protein product [Linum tenue]
MSLNMKTFTQALAKAGAVIEKTVQTTVQEVTGPKALQDYQLIDQIGSAGPGLAWKLYSARPVREAARQYPVVCEMGLLEVKHGLLQIAETLDFLHNNAHLIHRAIAPEASSWSNVLMTASGAWKLGGFCFTIPSDQGGNLASSHAFHYAEYDVEDSIMPLQPSLNYTAPELVRSKVPSAGSASDIFSFGCLAYHLIAHKPLFDCHNNVKMYMNTLNYLSSGSFSSIPSELVPDLQRMLSANESFRPSAMDFTGSGFFRNDTRLRALRFLDHLLERDNMQKSEFLKALSDMWKDFDSRVLRYKVLPPLCAELRNMVMQPMILPMVLTIAESQDKVDFELSTLPALVPVLSTAAGETLLLLVKHADLIINKASHETLVSSVLPMLVRAYDDTDPRIQEEVLKKSVSLAKQLDPQLVKQAILPRVHGLALKTTVAAVRVNALLCFVEFAHSLDKHAILDMLQTIGRCTAVDRSAPTLMCTLGVANSILKQFGVEFVAEHVLPLLSPLLIAQQLNVQQFAKYMLFVKDVLRMIEEMRGVSVSDSGIPEAKTLPFANGSQSQASSKSTGTVASAVKKSPSWDEDWGPVTKGSAPSKHPDTAPVPSISSNPSPAPTTMTSSGSQQKPLQSLSSMASQQPAVSCTPVDIEWPPRSSSSGVTPQQSDGWGQSSMVASSSAPALDDMDPFADWPPRPSSSTSNTLNNGKVGSLTPTYGSNFATITSNSSTQSNGSNSWAFNNKNSVTMGRGAVNDGGGSGMNPSHSLGVLKSNQGGSMVSSSNQRTRSSGDLESIFGSGRNNDNGALAPKLAPPPLTAVGRGRGRGRGTAVGSTMKSSSHANNKPQPGQPPLLDLL